MTEPPMQQRENVTDGDLGDSLALVFLSACTPACWLTTTAGMSAESRSTSGSDPLRWQLLEWLRSGGSWHSPSACEVSGI
jgi:hypothetical protein